MLLSAGERVTSSLLAIALQELGYKAVAFSGRQAGLKQIVFIQKLKLN